MSGFLDAYQNDSWGVRKCQKTRCIAAEDRRVLFGSQVRGGAYQRVYVIVPHVEGIIGTHHYLPGTDLVDEFAQPGGRINQAIEENAAHIVAGRMRHGTCVRACMVGMIGASDVRG